MLKCPQQTTTCPQETGYTIYSTCNISKLAVISSYRTLSEVTNYH